MSVAVNRVMLTTAGILIAIAGVVTVLIAPERSQLVVFIESGGANEEVVPFAYWAALTLWACLAPPAKKPEVAGYAQRCGVGVELSDRNSPSPATSASRVWMRGHDPLTGRYLE